MKCDYCSQQATIYISGTWQGKAHHLHLCRRCAKKKVREALELGAKLRELIDHVIKHELGQMIERQGRRQCHECGLTYAQFRKLGRLGCPADYEAFQPALSSLLEKLHGATRHRGRRPKGYARGTQRFLPRIRLRRQMFAAAEQEDYQRAIRLRELMRKRGEPHGSK